MQSLDPPSNNEESTICFFLRKQAIKQSKQARDELREKRNTSTSDEAGVALPKEKGRCRYCPPGVLPAGVAQQPPFLFLFALAKNTNKKASGGKQDRILIYPCLNSWTTLATQPPEAFFVFLK